MKGAEESCRFRLLGVKAEWCVCASLALYVMVRCFLLCNYHCPSRIRDILVRDHEETPCLFSSECQICLLSSLSLPSVTEYE